MLASIVVNRQMDGHPYTKKEIIDFLKKNGVKNGILEDEIERILEKDLFNQKIVIARGKECVNGLDGEYRYMFPDELSTAPKINEDGSVDYHDMNVFFMIEKDQILAEYTPPRPGIFGFRIDGSIIVPQKGEDLPMLRGRGFYMSKDRKYYYSSFSGKINKKGKYEIEILKVLVLENVDVSTGDVYFDGDILVQKDVRSGYSIKATGSISVNGHVEEAILEAGVDVVIKQGMHGNYRGTIKAGENVYGTFFEASIIEVDGDFTANYILNCNIISNGKVKLSGRKGSIIGGCTYGALGVEAYKIGNGTGIKTEVQAGVKKDLLDELVRFSDKYEKIDSELELLDDNKRKLEQRNNVPVEQLVLLEKINIAYDMKRKEIEELREKEEKTKKLLARATMSRVTGIGVIYKGTKVVVQTNEIVVNNDITHVYFCNEKNKGVVARRL